MRGVGSPRVRKKSIDSLGKIRHAFSKTRKTFRDMGLDVQLSHEVPGTLRGIIICSKEGQIRCAGSLANSWLRKYFPKTSSAKMLPSPVGRWLTQKGKSNAPFRMEKNGDILLITLIERGSGPLCLLLEETGAINHWCADCCEQAYST